MTKSKNGLRLFVSGERVEPGIYRDIETGAIVTVCEPDTLPDRVRLVRDQRLFARIEEASEAQGVAPTGRPRQMAEVA